MSLPHRIGACYCVLGETSEPESKRDPEHKINPGFKAFSNEGLKNEGDTTAVPENYGGGANSYFTSYPPYLLTKFKGSVFSDDQDFPEIEIKIEPYSNTTESRVIDNRSCPTSYNVFSQTLEEATEGKGEIMEVSKIFLWGDETPGNKLLNVEFPELRPLDFSEAEEAAETYADKKFAPDTRFQPWDMSLPPSGDLGDQNKANYLCSLRIPNCDITDLFIMREPQGMKEDPPDSGIFIPWTYYDAWSPAQQYDEASRYAAYFNTSSWRLYVKATECCWNKGYKISGTIRIAKRLLKFDPEYTETGPGYVRTIPSGQFSSLQNYPFFIGHRFVIDENFEPDLEFATIPWTVTIDEETAIGEWARVESNDFDIPSSEAGSAFEVSYICGFEVDTIEPPEPPE